MPTLAASSLVRIGASRALLLSSRGATSCHLATITSPSPLSTPTSHSPAPSQSSSSSHAPFPPPTTEYPAAWFMPPPPPPSPAPTALEEEPAFARLAARRLAPQSRMFVQESELRTEKELSLGDFVARVRKEEKGEALEGEKKKVCIKGCPTCSKRK